MKKAMVWIVAMAVVVALGGWVVGCSGGDKPDKPVTPDNPVTPDKPVVTPDKPVVTPDKPVDTPDKPADPGSAGKGGDVKTYSYVIEMESAEEGKMRMELKADGKKRMNMRMAMEEAGAWKDQLWLITDGKFSYMLDAAQKSGMKMPAEETGGDEGVPEDMVFVPTWDEYKAEYLSGVDVVEEGKEDINGISTTKYKVKGLEGTDSGFIYVDKDKIIRKLEGFDPTGKKMLSIVFVKVELDPKLTDADFTPPADFNIMDMSGMMKDNPGGMPGGMPPGGMPPGGMPPGEMPPGGTPPGGTPPSP